MHAATWLIIYTKKDGHSRDSLDYADLSLMINYIIYSKDLSPLKTTFSNNYIALTFSNSSTISASGFGVRRLTTTIRKRLTRKAGRSS